jgi:hypothetical protein
VKRPDNSVTGYQFVHGTLLAFPSHKEVASQSRAAAEGKDETVDTLTLLIIIVVVLLLLGGGGFWYRGRGRY